MRCPQSTPCGPLGAGRERRDPASVELRWHGGHYSAADAQQQGWALPSADVAPGGVSGCVCCPPPPRSPNANPTAGN